MGEVPLYNGMPASVARGCWLTTADDSTQGLGRGGIKGVGTGVLSGVANGHVEASSDVGTIHVRNLPGAESHNTRTDYKQIGFVFDLQEFEDDKIPYLGGVPASPVAVSESQSV